MVWGLVFLVNLLKSAVLSQEIAKKARPAHQNSVNERGFSGNIS